jgi:hypothetical protein
VAHKKIIEYLNLWKDKLQEVRDKLSEFQLLFAMENVSKQHKKNSKNSKKEKRPNPKLDALSDYAAQITHEFFLKVI